MLKHLFFLFLIALSLFANAQKIRNSHNKSITYIPIDLDDAIHCLNTIFSDSLKLQAKSIIESDFTSRLHLNFGMSLRNSWGLWAGSRLSAYFNTLGIYHPEDMSGIILRSYYRHNRGLEINLKGQIKESKDYWEKSQQETLIKKHADLAVFQVGDTVRFLFSHGYASKKQERLDFEDNCQAIGIVTGINKVDFLIKLRLLESCDKKGIIYYDNENARILKNGRWKDARHVVNYMKTGEELWMDYSDWEPK